MAYLEPFPPSDMRTNFPGDSLQNLERDLFASYMLLDLAAGYYPLFEATAEMTLTQAQAIVVTSSATGKGLTIVHTTPWMSSDLTVIDPTNALADERNALTSATSINTSGTTYRRMVGQPDQVNTYTGADGVVRPRNVIEKGRIVWLKADSATSTASHSGSLVIKGYFNKAIVE